MYTLILYKDDTVIETARIFDTPVVDGNSVTSESVTMNGIKADFIVIEGEFDGAIDLSKDIKEKLKPGPTMEQRMKDAEDAIFQMMMF